MPLTDGWHWIFQALELGEPRTERSIPVEKFPFLDCAALLGGNLKDRRPSRSVYSRKLTRHECAVCCVHKRPAESPLLIRAGLSAVSNSEIATEEWMEGEQKFDSLFFHPCPQVFFFFFLNFIIFFLFKALVTLAMSCIKLRRNMASNWIWSFSKMSSREPLGQYSVRRQQWGAVTLAPMKRTKWSWVTSFI